MSIAEQGTKVESSSLILKWTDTDKCFALAAISFIFGLSYIGAIHFLLAYPDFVPQFNRATLALGKTILPPLIFLYGVMAVVTFSLRKSQPDSTILVYLTLSIFSIPNTFLVYILGPVTNPLVGVTLVGTGVITMLMFKMKPAAYSFFVVIIGLIGLTIAESLELIPYAPLMAIEPTEAGRPTTWWVVFLGGLSLLATIALVGVFAWIVTEWRAREDLLEQLSNTDSLTQLTNRRRFMEILDSECERAKRTDRPLSMLMCDADLFKNVNDTYGHQVGDEVLMGISKVLRNSTRVATDVAARLGGEEFALLLAETDTDSANVVAQRILKDMREQVFKGGTTEFVVTMSIGLITLRGDEVDANTLMEISDTLLYEAKETGRDKVVMRNSRNAESVMA